jgi:membrane-associated phospholipid phosphatase
VTRAPPAAAPGAEQRRAAPRAAAARLFLQLRQRFREGRGDVGARSWHAWWITLAVGVAGTALLAALLVLAARWLLARGALSREADLLLWLARDGPLRFSNAVFFQTLGTDITLVMVVGVTAGIATWLRRPVTALSIIASFVVPDLVVRLGWLLWERPRPDVVHGGIASPGLHAFPSGHTAKSLAVYGLLTVLWVRASGSVSERMIAIAIASAIAVAVPLARLSMGVHWPSDVAGGAILGAAFLTVLAYGLRFERMERAAPTRR